MAQQQKQQQEQQHAAACLARLAMTKSLHGTLRISLRVMNAAGHSIPCYTYLRGGFLTVLQTMQLCGASPSESLSLMVITWTHAGWPLSRRGMVVRTCVDSHLLRAQDDSNRHTGENVQRFSTRKHCDMQQELGSAPVRGCLLLAGRPTAQLTLPGTAPPAWRGVVPSVSSPQSMGSHRNLGCCVP